MDMSKYKRAGIIIVLLCFMSILIEIGFLERQSFAQGFGAVNQKNNTLSFRDSNLTERVVIPNTQKRVNSIGSPANTQLFRMGKNSSQSFKVENVRNTAFQINRMLANVLKRSESVNGLDVCKVSNVKHYFVIPYPVGRLGNLMFMFASSLGIATMIRYQLVIPASHPVLRFFDFKNVSTKMPSGLVTYKENDWQRMTHGNNTEWLCHNFTIQGMLQNYRYFSHISETVRKSFIFKPDVWKTTKAFFSSVIPHNPTKIGIHIRRGDFLIGHSKDEGRIVANMNYINKAMNYFRKRFINVHFIVCSDDQRWSQDNMRSSDVTFSGFKSPAIDMAILSLCDHMIITVGTFSWWAGYLSRGTVVYLSDYPVPGSYLERFAPRDIYYPPEWIGMSNNPAPAR